MRHRTSNPHKPHHGRRHDNEGSSHGSRPDAPVLGRQGVDLRLRSEFVEFGGHTPCVEVRCGERLFVIDAGTGINAFGVHHRERLPQRIDLLLSHLHLDHVGGLPFMKPAVLNPPARSIPGAATSTGRAPPSPSTGCFRRRSSRSPSTCSPAASCITVQGRESLTFPDGAVVDTVPLEHPQAPPATASAMAAAPPATSATSNIPSPGPIRPCWTSCATRTSWSMTACSRRASTRPAAAGATRPGRRASNCAGPAMSAARHRPSLSPAQRRAPARPGGADAGRDARRPSSPASARRSASRPIATAAAGPRRRRARIAAVA